MLSSSSTSEVAEAGAQVHRNYRTPTGCVSLTPRFSGAWSLDILEGAIWVKGLWFYQAAAAWTMVWQVAGALPVGKVIGLSASCLRNSVTKSRQEGRLAPRRHLGKGA